jgi:hypothetical protein
MPRIRDLKELYGDSTTDTVIGVNAIWYGINAYRDLKISAGVTIQSGGTRYGPLILLCSGTLTVAGTLHANAKGEVNYSNFWTANGTINGGMNADMGAKFTNNFNESVLNALPIPGGGGGYANVGITQPSFLGQGSSSGWSGNIFFLGGYSATQVAPGTSGSKNGANGSSILSGLPALANLVNPLTGPFDFAAGCGGGLGAPSTLGGQGGGAILIAARNVVVVAGGVISANGGNGSSGGVAAAGGGGGGGGGSVVITTERCANSGTVQALGGSGGAAGTGTGGPWGAGGNGADGIVKVITAR